VLHNLGGLGALFHLNTLQTSPPVATGLKRPEPNVFMSEFGLCTGTIPEKKCISLLLHYSWVVRTKISVCLINLIFSGGNKRNADIRGLNQQSLST